MTPEAVWACWPTADLMHRSGYVMNIFKVGEIIPDNDLFEKTGDGYSVTVNQFLESGPHNKQALAACAELCKLFQKELREALEYVAHKDETKTVFQF
jgi:hypothetical protein